MEMSPPIRLANRTDATVTFTLAESGGTVACRLDDGEWRTCIKKDSTDGISTGTAGTFYV
jgi:hypothetical protein